MLDTTTRPTEPQSHTSTRIFALVKMPLSETGDLTANFASLYILLIRDKTGDLLVQQVGLVEGVEVEANKDTFLVQ